MQKKRKTTIPPKELVPVDPFHNEIAQQLLLTDFINNHAKKQFEKGHCGDERKRHSVVGICSDDTLISRHDLTESSLFLTSKFSVPWADRCRTVKFLDSAF